MAPMGVCHHLIYDSHWSHKSPQFPHLKIFIRQETPIQPKGFKNIHPSKSRNQSGPLNNLFHPPMLRCPSFQAPDQGRVKGAFLQTFPFQKFCFVPVLISQSLVFFLLFMSSLQFNFTKQRRANRYVFSFENKTVLAPVELKACGSDESCATIAIGFMRVS